MTPDSSQPYRSVHGIEQDRRDFMRDHPDLYRYIAYREAAKELRAAAGDASGALDGHGAANRVYRRAGLLSGRYVAMQLTDRHSASPAQEASDD